LDAIDGRLPRFDQGVLALAVVCGFVFEATFVIPAWSVMALLSAARPELSPIQRLFAALVTSPPPGRPRLEDGRPWRVAALLAGALLGLGTLVLAVGDQGAAWIPALAAAALGALASVGGLCLGCQMYLHRARQKGHRGH
jgi:hypothetical protein